MQNLPNSADRALTRLNELQRPLTPVEKVRHAHRQPKLRELHTDELLEISLKACVALCGIKPNNMPSKNQWLLMISAVKNHLGQYSPEEIKLAFEMYLAKKFNVKGLELSKYQNFTFESISAVLEAYHGWRHKNKYLTGLKVQEQKKRQPLTEQAKTTWQYITKDILTPYTKALNANETSIVIPDKYGTIYTSLRKSGFLDPPMELMKRCYQEARERIKKVGPKSPRKEVRADFAAFKSEDFPNLSLAQKRANHFHQEAARVAGNKVLHEFLNAHLELGTDLASEWLELHEERLKILEQMDIEANQKQSDANKTR